MVRNEMKVEGMWFADWYWVRNSEIARASERESGVRVKRASE